MKPPATQPLFLERASYRQRRLRDAVRMLPLLGGILMLLPLLGGEETFTSSLGIYFFGVWLLLIVISALIAARMTPDLPPDEHDR